MVPATGPVKLTGVVDWPAQTVWLAMAFTTAVGLTVMLNVMGMPTQLEVPFTNDGVIVMSAITGTAPVLVTVNGSMLPLPVAGKPMDGALFVQLYTIVPPPLVPFGLPNFTESVNLPLHNIWLAIGFTVVIGFTVITNVIGNPVQPNGEFGVTVIVALIEFRLLVVTKDGIFPVPLAANPIPGLLFTQV